MADSTQTPELADLTEAPGRLTRPLTVLLAVTSAVTAANVYLNQPLLGSAAADLHVSPEALGAVPTATQFGYAAGILLMVPAGDSHDRRRLILRLGAASTVALAASAVAPTAWWLIIASFLVGLLSPIPQLVAPLAVALAGDQRRGRVVGTIQGGLLIGVLASRAYSGSFAELAGWRAVYWCSCALTLLMTCVLWRVLPAAPAIGAARYRTTLASLPRLFASHPLIRRVTISGGLVGIAFGAFWTALTFLLEQDYHYGSTEVGLFGLVAAASALASPAAGRLADRMGPRLGLAALIVTVIAGWVLLLPGGTHLSWLIIGVVVLDIGVWGSQVVCQTSLFTLDKSTHNRLNTLYFTLRFLGIAIGSLAGSLAWGNGGWSAVATVGIIAALAGLVVGVLPHSKERAKRDEVTTLGA
ncbi:MFS transporter [Streptomyces varsoviensis]|uniref:Membrane protein n=1 Tax=Streptomyces varsoviensis TaxID=67373 RepID=A0ABR5IY80_9ACTN|nr:MFS transporter [Streptomyces varsoviensis]KOG86127.1 membrane protein [Streptomyces varsoviensis]